MFTNTMILFLLEFTTELIPYCINGCSTQQEKEIDYRRDFTLSTGIPVQAIKQGPGILPNMIQIMINTAIPTKRC